LEGIFSSWELKMTKRHRRKFSDEFKAETVKLIRTSGRTVAFFAPTWGPTWGSLAPISSQLNGMPLGSSGQRNTFAKFLCWGKILQCLPRALVESKSNLVEIRLGVLG
jgi:hypothetical protein